MAGTGGANNWPPVILSKQNWYCDDFCLSKAISEVELKWGSNTLKETSETRTPFLINLKSSFLDTEACKKHGLSPLAFDGIGNLTNVVGGIPTERGPIGLLTPANIANLPPLAFPETAKDCELNKIVKTAKDNGRLTLLSGVIDGVDYNPVFNKDGSGGGLNIKEWNDAWYAEDPDDSNNNYFGIINVTCYVKVKEYILCDFLNTPYSKNKTERMIKTTPNLYINFAYKYNTDYISNSLFKYFGFTNSAGTTTNATNLTVTRMPAQSRLTVESFDVYNPPQDDMELQFVKWRAKRVEAPVITNISDAGAMSTVNVIDQTSNVLPPYMILGADPEFWNGLQNASGAGKGFQGAGISPWQSSSFLPAKTTAVKLKIGQTEVTQNIPINILEDMMIDSIHNDDNISDILRCRKETLLYALQSYLSIYGGFPFLLLDLNKLNMQCHEYGQYMTNVAYPTTQTLSIQYTVQTQSMNAAPCTYNLYPQIYKMYPIGVYQRLGEQVQDNFDMTMSYAESINVLQTNYSRQHNVDLDFIYGAGWFDSAKDWIKEKATPLLKGALKGVRFGEKALRDTELADSALYKGLKAIDQGAKAIGYGPSKKGGGRALR